MLLSSPRLVLRCMPTRVVAAATIFFQHPKTLQSLTADMQSTHSTHKYQLHLAYKKLLRYTVFWWLCTVDSAWPYFPYLFRQNSLKPILSPGRPQSLMSLVLPTARPCLQKVARVWTVHTMLCMLLALQSERTVSRGRFMLMVRTSVRTPDRPFRAELLVTLSPPVKVRAGMLVLL